MSRSTVVLLCFCCILGIIVYYQLPRDTYSSAIHDLQIGNTFVTRTRATPDMHYSLPPRSQFDEIRNRPLFTQSRRPEQKVASRPEEIYQLRGTVLFDKMHIALLIRRHDGKSIRVHVGDMVDSWRITYIDSEAIGLSDTIRTHRIPIAHEWAQNASSFSDEGFMISNVQEFYEDHVGGQASPDVKQLGRYRSGQNVNSSEGGRLQYGPAAPSELPPPPPPLPMRSGWISRGSNGG